jgi:hypothetical protein
MTIPLKYNTASQEVPIGPFLDDTDGKTAETGLTIANTDIKLWKNGATTLANKNSGGATHISGGIYYAVLDATDTNTKGPMVMFVQVSGALPVRVECEVLDANFFDARYGDDRLQVDVREKGDSSLALTTQEKADVNAEVDGALDTAVPASPTANSINERIKTMDDAYTATRAGYLDNINNANLATVPAITSARIGYLDNINNPQLLNISSTILGRIDAAISSRSSHSAADVWSVATRSLTDKEGFRLSATGVDDVLDEVCENGLTLRQMLRIYLAALAGKSSNYGSTFRDNADSKNRIVATTDTDGNRTAVTLDGT